MNKTAINLQNTNPSLNPLEGPACPYCGEKSILRPASYIYTGRPDIEKNMWVCKNYPECDSYVGTHGHGAWQNFPMGILANRGLRDLKKRCHTLFDHQWKARKVPRGRMYVWLQITMGLSEPDAHIGELDRKQCERLLIMLEELYKKPVI